MNKASYYVAEYGKTWYEKEFNAILEDAEVYALYKKKVKTFEDAKMKIPLEQFVREYIGEKEHASNPMYEAFDSLYKVSGTYREFFSRLHKDPEYRPVFCETTYKWMEKFVKHRVFVDINTTWTIRMEDVPKQSSNAIKIELYPENETPSYEIQAGGRNVTKSGFTMDDF